VPRGLTQICLRLRSIFLGARVERDLNEELRCSHGVWRAAGVDLSTCDGTGRASDCGRQRIRIDRRGSRCNACAWTAICVQAWDPLTFTFPAAVLTMAALVASYVPARHAASVNPIEVLRTE
jgi:hypothetical protein